jgi:integrase
MQAWVSSLSTTLASSTVALVYGYAATIFRAAVEDGLIIRSPCSRINLPALEPRLIVPLAAAAVEQLADAMPGRYRALVVIGAGTGLRQGEIFGLTVDRIDFLRREVRVDRQLTLTGSAPAFAALKTAASYRKVPVPSMVLDELAAHLKAFGEGLDGLVFTDDARRPLRRNRFNEVWKAAVARAGLPASTHFHELRHFYASALIGHGCSVKAVQEALGHANATETLNTYAHLWPTDHDRIRAAVEATLRAAPPRDLGSGRG